MIIHWLYDYIFIPITKSILFGMPMAAAFLVSAGMYAATPGRRKWFAALIMSSIINSFFAFALGAGLFEGSFIKGFAFLILPMFLGIRYGYSLNNKREDQSLR